MVLLVQLVGNGLIVYLISTNQTLQKPALLIIGSMALSDFFSGCISPVAVYREQPGRIEFNWPLVVCDSYKIIEIMTSLATVMTVGSLSMYRLLTICCRERPILHNKLVQKSTFFRFHLNVLKVCDIGLFICYLDSRSFS